jgi:hypothetical protein
MWCKSTLFFSLTVSSMASKRCSAVITPTATLRIITVGRTAEPVSMRAFPGTGAGNTS